VAISHLAFFVHAVRRSKAIRDIYRRGGSNESAITMTHDEKVAYLMKDLGQKSVGQYTVAPPLYRLLWRLGVAVKPPYFAGFWSLVIITAVPFGIFWGIFMWFLIWRQNTPVGPAIGFAALAGLLFGFVNAVHIRRRARKLALPRWDDYPLSPANLN
jgi:hypothetical protein